MKNDEYVSYEVALLMKQLSYTEGCEYSYILASQIKQNILEQYPGLSDDGYLDLTKDYGGDLEKDMVYEYRVKLTHQYCTNHSHYQNVSVPHVYSACRWIRENYGIFIHVTIIESGYYIGYYQVETSDPISNSIRYSSYEEAVNGCLKFVLEKLIN